MKQITIQAQERTQLKSKNPKKIIRKGLVPGVLYGSKKQNIHFTVAAYDIETLKYDPFFINLSINNQTHPCILQAKQTHPVSDIPIHIDLLHMTKNKPITMAIPVKLIGKSVGTIKGGLLVKKIRKLKVKALPQNMPEEVVLDVTQLDLGKSIQVHQTPTNNYKICNAPTSLVATVEIPRALRSKTNQTTTSEG